MSLPSGGNAARLMNHPVVTQLEHNCHLNIDKAPHAIKKTGIVCTLGPASQKPDVLREMMKAGMTIARLNFSHGTHEYHAKSVQMVREAAATFPGLHLGIALDTKGPEVRTGTMAGDETKAAELRTGSIITITTDDAMKDQCSSELVYLDYKRFTKECKVGQKIFVDDGLMNFEVRELIDDLNVKCEVICGGSLSGKKGVNLPGIEIDLPAISDTDEADLKFAVELGLDMVFASFVRDGANVKHIREILGEKGKNIQIISKIENHQGLRNLDEIIETGDGLMVARGDLGVQIPQEKLTVAQKVIISKGNRSGKPVICATQMMDSMTNKPRPTRAEISDVTNAVLDGADCVMLSGESAKGAFPVETVRTMAEICREAEKIFFQRKFFTEMRLFLPQPCTPTHATAISAVEISLQTYATAIIVLSTTGQAARFLSKYKPHVPIIAVLADTQTARVLQLCRGVIPVVVTEESQDWVTDTDRKVQSGIKLGFQRGFVRTGDPLIVVTGWKQGQGYSNTIRIIAAPAESVLTV
ncbi:Pyruvate kinase PKM [Hypsibius exemplaris]|uniref:Pyruvate kinase n=1 Tax=Hypsibius exemplaris TaxID=2072580 RepID=A0A1W0WEF2_HYPEX|nr:Pyruvate kinase PKM [Hypsibius exemplaris]